MFGRLKTIRFWSPNHGFRAERPAWPGTVQTSGRGDQSALPCARKNIQVRWDADLFRILSSLMHRSASSLRLKWLTRSLRTAWLKGRLSLICNPFTKRSRSSRRSVERSGSSPAMLLQLQRQVDCRWIVLIEPTENRQPRRIWAGEVHSFALVANPARTRQNQGQKKLAFGQQTGIVAEIGIRCRKRHCQEIIARRPVSGIPERRFAHACVSADDMIAWAINARRDIVAINDIGGRILISGQGRRTQSKGIIIARELIWCDPQQFPLDQSKILLARGRG